MAFIIFISLSKDGQTVAVYVYECHCKCWGLKGDMVEFR